MEMLLLECPCGNTFILANRRDTEPWNDFMVRHSFLGLWMDEHGEHGNIIGKVQKGADNG